MVELQQALLVRLAHGRIETAAQQVRHVEHAAAAGGDLPVDDGERRTALGRREEEVVGAVVAVDDRVRPVGDRRLELDDARGDLLGRLAHLRREAVAEVLDERLPRLLVRSFRRLVHGRIDHRQPLGQLFEARVIPPRRVEPGDLADREFRFFERASRRMVADAGGSEILDQQDVLLRVAVHRAVVELRRAQLDLVGDLFVEADLAVVEVEEVADVPPHLARGREFREERRRRAVVLPVVRQRDDRELADEAGALADHLRLDLRHAGAGDHAGRAQGLGDPRGGEVLRAGGDRGCRRHCVSFFGRSCRPATLREAPRLLVRTYRGRTARTRCATSHPTIAAARRARRPHGRSVPPATATLARTAAAPAPTRRA